MVLAVFPSTQGFGFVVFEGSRALVEWGVRHVKGKNKNVVAAAEVSALISEFKPDIFVTEDYAGDESHRRPRIRSLIRMMCRRAKARPIEVRQFSRGEIRVCFAPFGARTKHEIGQRIVVWFPELKPLLPKKRRAWMSENPRMAIYDAIALAMCHFDSGAE